jgi:hypothetical protein
VLTHAVQSSHAHRGPALLLVFIGIQGWQIDPRNAIVVPGAPDCVCQIERAVVE